MVVGIRGSGKCEKLGVLLNLDYGIIEVGANNQMNHFVLAKILNSNQHIYDWEYLNYFMMLHMVFLFSKRPLKNPWLLGPIVFS